MKLPSDIYGLICHMQERGIGAFVVGGAVRDIIMGKEPSDYDMAAECTPGELVSAFEGYKSFDIGIQFGTLTVFSGERYVEITCCRRENEYTDHRRPDGVEYCKSIEEDLCRRDFTVNAIAMDKDGEIIDPFGGQADIKNKLIRAVGDPEKRFREDALRILRALRFSSCLCFDIDKETKEAISACRELLSCVSAERVFAELKKLLLGENVFSVLHEFSKEICTVIPELSPCVGFDQHNSYHIYTVYDHIAHAVEKSPADTDIRLAMLLHDVGKPPLFFIDEKGIGHFWGHPELSEKMAREILLRLKADRETVEHVCHLIKYHDVRPEATRKSLHKYASKVGFKAALELIHVRRADVLSQAPQYFYQLEGLQESERIIRELMAEGACVSISDMMINGKDLIDMGFPEGKKVGEILRCLLKRIIKEDIKNDREELLREAKKLL